MTTRFNRLAGSPLIGIVTLMIGSSALLLAAQPVSAQDVRRMTVSTAGADLGTNAGRQLVRERIARAAKKVCAADDIRDLRSQHAQKLCVQAAVAHSRLQLANILASRPLHAGLDASAFPSVVSPEDEKSS